MTPWLVAYASGMALAVLFMRGATRKPSPRRVPTPQAPHGAYPTRPTRGTVDPYVVTVYIDSSSMGTTGWRCTDNAELVYDQTNSGGADVTGPAAT